MDNERALQSVDELLRSIVNSDVDVLREASHHILEAGGKRVRPRLTLLAYEAVGGTNLDEVVPVAAAVELVHTATLVHDDINDHGSLRRGRPTVNARWGRTFALLTGDYLFTKVYELMAPYKDLNIIFAQATIALVEGETLQAAAAKSGQLDRETYTRIIAKKTASLFAAACKLGAILGGGTKEQVDALEQYGFNLGLAFQIVDDILDLIADSKKLGKTAGIDVAQGKGLATALATSGGSSKVVGTATAVLEAEPAADPMAAFKQKMLSGGYIEEGQRNAEQLSALATMSLSVLPPSPAVTALQALTRQVVERDH
ncbi:MAG: polyprenyl synthetase family protein [Anaerolineae bacterium]|nr:polyprenyl synthetase family protein [Anaerolineae bacterium]